MDSEEKENEQQEQEEYVDNKPKNVDPTKFFTIEVSDDKMAAYLTIDTMSINLEELASYQIQDYLTRSELDPDLIDYSAVNYVFSEINKIKKGQGTSTVIHTLVATGQNPEKGEDGWVKYHFPYNRKVVIKEDGSADFRNIEKYVSVKKEQLLASVFHGMVGKPGRDVRGTSISPPPILRPKLTIGKNIRSEDREEFTEMAEVKLFSEYYSNTDGAIYATENSIAVSPELIIDTNVGLSTGNIKFDGSVVIKGTVEVGSKVECTGSLVVNENIESADIVVGGDLIVRGGVKTGQKGTIKVKGSVKTKFIENTILELDGDLHAEISILNSKVYCLGSIIFSGKTNAIMGSDIIVYNGLSVYNLGSNAGLTVNIDMGIHYRNERLFNELHEKIKEVEKEMDKYMPKIQQAKTIIQKSRGKLDAERKKKYALLFAEFQKLNNNLKALQAKYEEMKTGRFNLEKVNLVVSGSAFPGAVIRYRRQIEKISKTQTAFMMNFFPGQDHAPMTAINSKSRQTNSGAVKVK